MANDDGLFVTPPPTHAPHPGAIIVPALPSTRERLEIHDI